MKILSGHTSKETAYLVDDYPYGFRLRCKIRYWLEHHPKHGTRLVSQTTNPRATASDVQGSYVHNMVENGGHIVVWNKPKASTYCKIAGAMYLDEDEHVRWSGLGIYADLEECRTWVVQFGESLPPDTNQRVWNWIEEKEAYKIGGKDAWLRLKLQRRGIKFEETKQKQEIPKDGWEPVPCKKCGRTDLPLHTNYQCAECGPSKEVI